MTCPKCSDSGIVLVDLPGEKGSGELTVDVDCSCRKTLYPFLKDKGQGIAMLGDDLIAMSETGKLGLLTHMADYLERAVQELRDFHTSQVEQAQHQRRWREEQ